MMNIYSRSVLISSMILFSCNSNDQGKSTENKENIDIRKFSEPDNIDDPENGIYREDSDAVTNNETDEIDTQKILSPEKVKDHIGKIVIVIGVVSDVHVSEKVAYFNFGNKFPKNDFSGIVFKDKFSEFDDLENFKDKLVEITGNVSVYRNKPQIILNSSDQIKILK